MPGGPINGQSNSFRLSPSLKRILQPLLIAGSFLLLSIALEHVTSPLETAGGVKQFYLPAGLNLSLLLSCGLQYAPVLVLSNLIADLWLDPLPASPVSLVILATAIGLTYMLGAALVRLLLARSEARLQGRKGFSQLLQAGLAVSVMAAMIHSIGSASAGAIQWGEVPIAFLGAWSESYWAFSRLLRSGFSMASRRSRSLGKS